MNVLSFKLVTGEEIVARVNSTEEDQSGKKISYLVSSAQVLQFQPTREGRMALALVPWTLSNPDLDDIRLPAVHVVTSFPPSADVEREYIRQTSKIALA